MGKTWRRGARALGICWLVLGGVGCDFGDEGGELAECAQGSAIGYRPCIQHDLEVLGCLGCHERALTAGGMVLIPAPQTEQDWQDNYGKVRLQALAQGRGGMPIRLVAKARGGGGHVAANEQAEPVLQRWIDWGVRGAPFEVFETFENREATGGEGP